MSPLLALIHIRKTGGSRVNHFLRTNFSYRHCDRFEPAKKGDYVADDDISFARLIFPGLRSITGHPIGDPLAVSAPDMLWYTFLRDPFTRAASDFQHWSQRYDNRRNRRAGVKRPVFEDWFADPYQRNQQVQQLAGCQDVERAKRAVSERLFFVGITEKFDESVQQLAQLCPYPLDTRIRPIPGHDMDRVSNRASNNRIKDELLGDPSKREVLAEANALDLELYRWVLEEVLPRQEERVRDLPEQSADVGARYLRNYRLSKMFNSGVYRPALRLKYAFS